MYFSQWPLLSLFFTLFVIFYITGLQLGKSNSKIKGDRHYSRVSSIQAGLMGILGVMLAFSFSLSSQRYEQRRSLIYQESVKIESAYFRSGLLPDSLKSEIRNLLKMYLNERINFYKAGNSNEDMQQIQHSAQRYHLLIWSKITSIGRTKPNLNTNINILSITEMIEIAGIISASFQSHLPDFIIFLLVFIAICTIFIMGYNDGFSTERNILLTIVLNLVLCSILFLIMDLDRPTTGFLKADIYGLNELKEKIKNY